MALAYYISSHGYGHLVRSCAIIRELPPEIPLIIKTAGPRKVIDAELKGRQYELIAERFDCGAIQPDSFAVDALATLQTYQRIADENGQRLEAEVNFLKQRDVRAVACDIPPFACRAAHAAGVPSIAMTNFTWYEIYRPLVRQHPRYQPLLDAIRGDYALATKALVYPPHLPIDVFPNAVEAPMVARKGEDRSAAIKRALNIPEGHLLYMLYLGDMGLAGTEWRALETFERASFLTLNPLSVKLRNVYALRNEDWWHPDLTASCAAVIGKPGYGLVGECMANSTPLVYTERPEFVEYFALHDALQQWGGGIFVPLDKFRSLQLQPFLEQAQVLHVEPLYAINGAEFCAREIAMIGGWV